MDYGSLVTTARSCRRFDAARPIPLSILVWLVDLARIAPCGANRQALRYVVCNDRTRNDRVFGALRWAACAGQKNFPRRTGNNTVRLWQSTPLRH